MCAPSDKLLQEAKRPLKPEELARLALERGWATSGAVRVPKEYALQTVLRKNVRDNVGNNPRLVVVRQTGCRGLLLGLPEWETTVPERKRSAPVVEYVERKIQLTSEIAKQIELVRGAGITKTFDDAVLYLLRKGWAVVRPEVQAELNRFLSDGGSAP